MDEFMNKGINIPHTTLLLDHNSDVDSNRQELLCALSKQTQRERSNGCGAASERGKNPSQPQGLSGIPLNLDSILEQRNTVTNNDQFNAFAFNNSSNTTTNYSKQQFSLNDKAKIEQLMFMLNQTHEQRRMIQNNNNVNMDTSSELSITSSSSSSPTSSPSDHSTRSSASFLSLSDKGCRRNINDNDNVVLSRQGQLISRSLKDDTPPAPSLHASLYPT